MKIINKFLAKIPVWLSSKVSIFIYLFLFIYLVLIALLSYIVPAVSDLAPTLDTQSVLGNYTNILSALGASLAAGSGVAIHSKIKTQQKEHEKLHEKIDRLHKKIDTIIHHNGHNDLPQPENLPQSEK